MSRIVLSLFLFLSLFSHDPIIGGETIENSATKALEPIRKKTHRSVLITGCGRSGTGYMALFLKRSGLRIKHEHMGEDGSVSWLMAADVEKAPWGPLYKNYTFSHVFHQVRDPLKVIQSYYNVPPGATWEWISYVIPEIKMEDSKLTKCAKYWYYWNLMAESKAEWTYRIEDFDSEYKEMARRLGLNFDKKILNTVPKQANSKGPPKRVITWQILKQELSPDLFFKMYSLALYYGYVPKA